MISEAYKKMKHLSPSVFENKFAGGTALVLATGLSTKKIIKYKDKIQDKFDVVIGLNRASDDFDQQLTHHLVVEKNPVDIHGDMKKNPNNYRKDLPRILNFKGLHRYPKDLNIMKVSRTTFDGKPDIRKYNNNNCEGLLVGPLNKRGFSVGTVSLQALHLAGIFGCSKVYLIGVDLIFGDKFDHYYEDRKYRDFPNIGPNQSPIVSVKSKGKEYKTTEYFRDSASYLDDVIENMCKPAGIEVYSFSDSLLASPIYLDIDEFFKEE